MKPRWPRLSFHSRILLAFVGLSVLAVLGASSVMYIAARRNGLGLAEQQLRVTDRVFQQALLFRSRQMTADTATLASDFGFREAVTSHDKPTIVSALENHRIRIHADVFAMINDGGAVAASTDRQFERSPPAALPDAIRRARLHDTAATVLNFRGELLQLVVVPVKAPDLVGWVCVGWLVNDTFVEQIKDTAGSDISLLTKNADESGYGVVASTLSASARRMLELSAGSLVTHDPSVFEEVLGEQSFLSFVSAGSSDLSSTFSVVSQMPMTAVAAPIDALRRDMILFGGLVSIICFIAAIFGARMLAEPVRALSNAARSLSMSKRRGGAAGGDDELAHVARAFHALARRAHYDGLTGLPNRTLLNQRLTESLARMERGKHSLAVIFIDLNGFKKINDTLGHEMGDLVLRKTAQRLARLVGAPNTVARLGGDEFVLVLERIDQSEAVRTIEGISKVIARSMVSPNGPIKVGMSAGIAMYPTQAVDQEELLQLADAAMYLSKTRKIVPILAMPIETVRPSPSTPTEAEISDPANGEPNDDTVSTGAWAGRDLVTQSTRAISVITGPKVAEIPSTERERLRALRGLKYLDKPSRASFDRITRLAARSLNVPIALISLVDENRQWFLSRVGIDATETPRDVSFCAHAIFERKLLVVPDAVCDDRFSGNPLVMEEPKIRAYAGAPIYTVDGHAIGTLCVVDKRSREFAEAEIGALQDLASIVDDIIRIREFTLAYDRRRRQQKQAKKVSSGDFKLFD